MHPSETGQPGSLPCPFPLSLGSCFLSLERSLKHAGALLLWKGRDMQISNSSWCGKSGAALVAEMGVHRMGAQSARAAEGFLRVQGRQGRV